MYLYALYVYYIFIYRLAKSNLINPYKLKPVKPCKKTRDYKIDSGPQAIQTDWRNVYIILSTAKRLW